MNGGAEPAHSQTPGRILITADAVGGVWQYTVDLTRRLMRDGAAVAVATMGPRPSEQQQCQLPPDVHVCESDYPLEWSSEPWTGVKAAGDWLLGLRDEFQPDLVHLNGYAHASLAWELPVLVVAHSCVVSWWRAVHGADPGPEWDEYRLRVRAGLMASDRVVAPSHFMAGEIATHYQIPAKKISTIPNFSSAGAAQSRTKESFCLAAGRVWDEAKNFVLLREVARHISWPIYLAGGGEASGFGPVRLLGSVAHHELLERMASASVFVHPALYEPFGLAVLEAAQASCCLVIADTASARELWGGAAILLDPCKPAQWADVLNRLSKDSDECTRRGREALERSRSYSEERFHAAYREVYRTLMMPRNGQKEAAA